MKLNEKQFQVLDKAVFWAITKEDLSAKQRVRLDWYLNEMIDCYDYLDEDEDENFEKLTDLLGNLQEEFCGYPCASQAENALKVLKDLMREIGY